MAVFKEDKKETNCVIKFNFWIWVRLNIINLLDNNSSDLTRAEPTLETAQTPSPLDFPFNCSEIKKGIKRLQNSKKECTDLILNEFIKTGNSTLILTLVKAI